MSTKFTGYIVNAVYKDYQMIASVNCSPDQYTNPIDAPYCPLAAVGKALDHLCYDLDQAEAVAQFYDGEVFLQVLDIARGTFEVYDIDKMNFEIDLEVKCG